MTRTAVQDLQPGDATATACFVARTAHPLWPDLQLVVWRMAHGGWSHDALDPRQVVGNLMPASSGVRTARLQAALVDVDGDWTQVR